MALLLAGQAGCMGFCHPLQTPPAEELACCADVVQCQKHKVYIVFVHGCDVLDVSNFQGLHDYVQSLGYIKTYFGNLYHGYHFVRELRKLHKDQRDARVVLVGFGKGAGMARDVACSVRDDGVCIDLLVYLDGVDKVGRPLHPPCNVGRVINVLSCDAPPSAAVNGAENVRYEGAGHHAVAADQRTLCLLARELADVARRVPIVRREPAPLVPAGSQLPAPREVAPQLPPPKEIGKDAGPWNFLQADAHAHGAMGLTPVGEALAAPPATMPRR
jgi:hypothetical protein